MSSKMTSPTPPSATTITCLCRTINEPSSIIKDAHSPIGFELCHCDTCRHSSGAIAGSFIELATPPSSNSLSKCVKYASSNIVSRFFCKTCGSHVFVKGYAADKSVAWYVWTACVDRSQIDGGWDVDVAKVEAQAFVSDTKDGGLVSRMVDVANAKGDTDNEIFDTVYANGFNGPNLSFAQLEELISRGTERARGESSDRLLAKCHCGSVQFYVTKPNRMKQYPEKVREHILKWGENGLKWAAKLCVCRSCAVATGNPLHAWTYVPPEHIVLSDGSPVGFVSSGQKPRLMGIKQYKSSENVTWSFCKTCGATVFYETVGREWCIDIGVGLLRSESGALAEDFLEWTWDKPSGQEDCQVHETLRTLLMDESVLQ